MIANKNCNLCLEVAGKCAPDCGEMYGKLVSTRKNILYETKNFMVIPSIGPLNDTHAMVIPKDHFNSFSELSEEYISESNDILIKLKNHIKETVNKDLSFFESGAGKLSNHAGGCINHAHIHCIASSNKFSTRLKHEVSLTETKTDDFSTADKNHGYIWFKDWDNTTFICNAPLLPSQFLRYLYAQCGDSPSSWNWRRHNNFDSILRVIETYKNILDN